MNQSLWIAKTGLDAQQTRMSVVANNLANVNTNGFKKGRAVFEDLIYQTIRQPGAQATQDAQLPSGLTLGMGVRTVATEKLFAQGGFVQTENSLDLAIEGRGFFQILMPNGDMGYTRDGSFQLNADGEVVMSNGYALQPGLTVPANALSVSIGKDGTVTAQLPGQAAPQRVGQHSTRRFRQSRRIAGDGREHLSGDRGIRGGADVQPWRKWRRNRDSGGLGDQQRQHGGGTGQHDRDPARL